MKTVTANGTPVRQKPTQLPVMAEKCGTCPFREGSPYEYLREDLVKSALNEASRVCHSTGSGNAINYRTGKPPALCRGARDAQLKAFHEMGFLDEPTDKAWDAKCRELGMIP